MTFQDTLSGRCFRIHFQDVVSGYTFRTSFQDTLSGHLDQSSRHMTYVLKVYPESVSWKSSRRCFVFKTLVTVFQDTYFLRFSRRYFIFKTTFTVFKTWFQDDISFSRRSNVYPENRNITSWRQSCFLEVSSEGNQGSSWKYDMTSWKKYRPETTSWKMKMTSWRFFKTICHIFKTL